MKSKKIKTILISVLLLGMLSVGCAKNESSDGFDAEREISVVARDAASGTRGAFHEIMGIIQKQGDAEVDNLVVGALEFDGTDKVITAVEGDKYGIGYISLGSVSERIKAVAVDGINPTVENVLSGDYSVSRPFLLLTKGTESSLVKDFLNFTQSAQGIKAAMDGSYDIGMSSRELKEEEASQLNRYVLAIDGIAVIVNNENPTDNLDGEDITGIYTGEITKWSEVK